MEIPKASGGAEVALLGVSRSYGDVQVVADVSLTAHSGEILALLGPSGCGKTTTLRMIAGLVEPSAGEITIDGRSVLDLPVHRRNLGMLFQSYALFPHMNVEDNVAFGLRMRDAVRSIRRPAATRGDGARHRIPPAGPSPGRALWRT